MNRKQHCVRTTIHVIVISLMAERALHAGAFSLYTESSAAAIGNFAAGIAAEARDASTGWYNPAGLVLLNQQEAVVSGVGVFPSTRITGMSRFNTIEFEPYVQSFSHLQGAENAVVPALHYALPLGERAAFGLSLTSPFGLSTNWGTTSPVRYSATLSQLMTINVSPELGGQLTDHLYVGAGLDLQWARVKFNSVIGSPAALQFLQSIGGDVTPQTLDSTTDNQGTSFGFGFHVGGLGVFNEDHTRIGLNYQSGVDHRFTGRSVLTGRLADPALTDPTAVFQSDVLFSNEVQLPGILTLSGYQDLNPQWALLGSIVYSNWSVFNHITLNNIAAFSTETGTQALVNSYAIENYRNTWRAALGANYQMAEQWLVRMGTGYDQTPTVNGARDLRLPDSDRFALSIGSHYQWRYNIGVDIGYTYLFGIGHTAINKTQVLDPESYTVDVATAKNNAQLVGLQVVWDIDKLVAATK